MYSQTIKVSLFLALLVSVTLISSSNFAYADHNPGHLTVNDPNFVISSNVQWDSITIQPSGILTITPNGILTAGSAPADGDAAILILPGGQLIIEADFSVEPRQNGQVISWGLFHLGTIIIDGTFNEFEATVVQGPGVILERCGIHESHTPLYQGLAPQPHPDGCTVNTTEQNNWTLEDDVLGVDYTVEDGHELIITGDTIIRGTLDNKGTIRNLSHVLFEGGTIQSIGSTKIIHICQEFEDGSTGISGFFGSGAYPTSPPVVSFTTCALPTAIDDGSDVIPFASTNADVILTSDSSINVMLGSDNDFDADFDPTSGTYDPTIVDFLPELTTSAETSSTKGGIVGMNSAGTFSYDPNGKFDTLKLGILDTDTFTYTLDDGTGGTDTAIVTIGIVGVSNDPPVITIEPPNPASVEVTATYVDAGATCSDKEDGPITVVVSGLPVDTSAVTSVTVNYSCTDSDGNIDLVSRTVNVIDTTIPVITRLGSDPVNTELNGGAYVDAGATASDVADGDITSSIVIVNPVDVSTLGAYVVTYNVDDSQDNSAVEVTRTVNVEDTTDPVIELVGSTPVSVELNLVTYDELGATVTDNDPNTSATATIGGDTVDESTLGTYIVTYNVDDSQDNSAVEVTRTVNVEDTTDPVISIVGSTLVSIVRDVDTYTELGATVTDNDPATISPAIVGGETVDESTLGTYVVTYNRDDPSGNFATEIIRTVNVVTNDSPVITIEGDDPVTVIVDDVYVDVGATALDTEDGDLTSAIVTMSDVNTAIAGSYTVEYSVTDSDDNTTIEVRDVTVVQTNDSPVITIEGNNPVTVIVDDVYVDAGATALDTEDGDLTSAIVTMSDVNTAIAGSYTVEYSVTDSDDNTTIDSRMVTVMEESVSLRFEKFEQTVILESLIEDSSKKTQKELEKSIKEINKSLDDKSWIDNNTLDSKHGKKVFDHEKHAVMSLMKIDDSTDVSGVIDVLVEVDRTLASDAIDELDTPENEDNDKVQKELDKAEKELEKGDEEAAQGKFNKAIDKYKKAWEHTQHAIKHL